MCGALTKQGTRCPKPPVIGGTKCEKHQPRQQKKRGTKSLLDALPGRLRAAFIGELAAEDAADMRQEVALAATILTDQCRLLSVGAEDELIAAIRSLVHASESIDKIQDREERTRAAIAVLRGLRDMAPLVNEVDRQGAIRREIGVWADRLVQYRAQALRKLEAERRYVSTEELMALLGRIVGHLESRLPAEYNGAVYDVLYELLPSEFRREIPEAVKAELVAQLSDGGDAAQ